MNKLKKIICLIICIIIPASSLATFDVSDIPPEIPKDKLDLSAKTKDSEYTLTGIRFDLDDENMPVIIVKTKKRNISERSANVSNGLWIFSHDPEDILGSMLKSGTKHYKKEYIGVKIEKTKKGDVRVKSDKKKELAPGEEYEWEYVYQIDNFSDPVYMYFMTEENSINGKWKRETIVVIPESGSVRWYMGKKE